MTLTVFGIRHHGPGCARSLRAALDRLRPDLVLIEGPPDADGEIAAAAQEGMVPPVALLVYDAEAPQRGVFYPFAAFSPEWQAIQWALVAGVPVRFCDLPIAHWLALEKQAPAARDDDEGERVRGDPFDWFARADGYGDGERWWNDKVEERGDDVELFAAILEAVGALRDELRLPEAENERRREAWMWREVRRAQREAKSVALVCGAWHAPRIAGDAAPEDGALLAKLPKVKVRVSWTPWTNERLTFASGYGAGVRSPGWYEHVWRGGEGLILRWLVRGARALRGRDFEASSASVIEATRLADALAGLRGRPRPGYDEAMEAMTAVLCGGDPTPLGLLRAPLLVGEAMGALPEGLARLPLQADLEAQQRSLRLVPKASVTTIDLDLRQPMARERSVLLHRLLALAIAWGSKEQASGRGTFKERWTLAWRPELVIAVVEASRFGNTIAAAAAARLLHAAPGEAWLDLGSIVERLELSLLADLPDASTALLARLDATAAEAHEPSGLLGAIPPLARLLRYGSVRPVDQEAVAAILRRLAARLHAGLRSALCGIDAEGAAAFAAKLRAHDAALSLVDAELRAEWHAVAQELALAEEVHAQVRGLAVRLLYEAQVLAAPVVHERLCFAASSGQEPAAVAAWLEGFLAGGGSVLVHDPQLLGLVDGWVGAVAGEAFTAVLPLLRRTFATFAPAERRKIGESLAAGRPSGRGGAAVALDIDAERARPAVELVARLLGLGGGAP